MQGIQVQAFHSSASSNDLADQLIERANEVGCKVERVEVTLTLLRIAKPDGMIGQISQNQVDVIGEVGRFNSRQAARAASLPADTASCTQPFLSEKQ